MKNIPTPKKQENVAPVVEKRKKKKASYAQKIIALLSVTAAFVVTAVVVLSLFFAGVIDGAVLLNKRDKNGQDETAPVNFVNETFSEKSMPSGKYATFTFTCEDEEYTVTTYLFTKYAPNTVSNFVSLTKKGFYYGTAVRSGEIEYDGDGNAVSGRMVCGGYLRNAEGTVVTKVPTSGAEPIRGEFYDNGYEGNLLSNTAGVIGMIHTKDNDDATTDFYMLPYDDTSLNGKYAAFGKATTEDGIKTIRFLTKKAAQSVPVSIKSVVVTDK